MRSVVVYESMFGNTRRVAEAIAEGLSHVGDVTTCRVTELADIDIAGADLIVVGGPTHAHGLSLPLTRAEAVRQAGEPDSGLALEPHSTQYGVREWLASEPELPPLYAAFDTRADAFKWFTGSAATHIAKTLGKLGHREVVEAGSFLAPDNDIDLSELDRARDWATTAGKAALEATVLRHSRH
jgi:hypothetical protein